MFSAVHHLAGHWEALYYQKSYAGLQGTELGLGQVAPATTWFQVKQTMTSFHDTFLLIWIEQSITFHSILYLTLITVSVQSFDTYTKLECLPAKTSKHRTFQLIELFKSKHKDTRV